jgi:thiol:disulfide interchange protein
MGLAAKLIVLGAVLWAATVWISDLDVQGTSVFVMLASVIGAMMFAWVVGRWLSRRRRRRMSQMRDSALW